MTDDNLAVDFNVICECGHPRPLHGALLGTFNGMCYWEDSPLLTYCRCDGFNPAVHIIHEEDDWDALVI